MPLVKCADCGTEVSDQAPACPKCGRPIATHVTERTSRRIKSHVLGAVFLMIVGPITCMAGLPSHAGGDPNMYFSVFGTLAFLGGLTWYIISRFRAWWRHG